MYEISYFLFVKFPKQNSRLFVRQEPFFFNDFQR